MGEETLRVWVERCQHLRRRKTAWSSNHYSVKVYELPAGASPPILASLSYPVSYVFGSGRQDDVGDIVFPRHIVSKRYLEVIVSKSRLRFEVLRHLRTRKRSYVVGFVEIELEDLKRRSSWRLLISDPVSHEACYGGDKTRNIRKPSFLILRTLCNTIEGEDDRIAVLPSPTMKSPSSAHCATKSRPARQRLSTSGSRRMGRVKVHVLTRGTRGDVQPFVALARGLAKEPYNCDVTICTEIIWKKFVKSSGKDLPEGSLSFRPCGGNTMRKMSGAAAQWVLRNGQSFDTLQALMLSRSEVEFFPSEGCFYHWAEEERPDFIIFGLTCTHVAMIISEALKIPIVGFLLQPTSEIQSRSAPLTATDQALDPIRNVVSGPQFNAVIKQIMEHVGAGLTLNDLRLSRGLLAAPRDIRDYSVHYSILAEQNVPLLTPISPLVRGNKASYLPGLTFTDFIFLRMGAADKLDDEIGGFVSRAKAVGRPIVLITFSSMPVGEQKLLKLAKAICTYCKPQHDNGLPSKRPAVIAMAAGQDHDPAPASLLEDVSKLGKEGRLLVLRRGAPFGALFPLLDALVLHGGLGVTSEAFYAGLPVVTCGILVMDQRYWAARCDEIGCGCEGVPINQAVSPSHPNDPNSPPRIVELINKALDKRISPGGYPTWTQNAQELQKQLMTDPDTEYDGGVKKNADVVYKVGFEDPCIVENAYIDQQGCLCAFFRQQKCCCKCWCYCIRWCICSQIPRLLMLLLVCLSWCFCFGPIECIRRKRKKSIDDSFDFDSIIASPTGAFDLTATVVNFARERALTQASSAATSRSASRSPHRSSDTGATIIDLDLELGQVGEEAQVLDFPTPVHIRNGILPCDIITPSSTANKVAL